MGGELFLLLLRLMEKNMVLMSPKAMPRMMNLF